MTENHWISILQRLSSRSIKLLLTSTVPTFPANLPHSIQDPSNSFALICNISVPIKVGRAALVSEVLLAAGRIL